MTFYHANNGSKRNKKKYKIHLEANENGNTTYETYKMQQKHF